jgi:hypothetical protein
VDLSHYRWKNRLLLVFSASREAYKEQFLLLEGLEPDFEDRDLLLGKFLEGETGELDGLPASTEDPAKLRTHLDIHDARFAVVLIGKDGGEKFRSHEPVSMENLFERIDAMPMRRQEINEDSA